MDLDNLHWGWRVASMLVAVPLSLWVMWVVGLWLCLCIDKASSYLRERF